jgi:hypothetical protein
MIFAQRVFLFAGILGVLMLVPMYVTESYISEASQVEITHPEFYYGLVGVGLAWQVAFLVMSRDPLRFRPLMLPAMLEKFSFSGAAYVLFALGRVRTDFVAVASVDFVLGILFVLAYRATSGAGHA